MPLTKITDDINDADLVNCIATRGNADNTTTIYYKGETVPPWPGGSQPVEDWII